MIQIIFDTEGYPHIGGEPEFRIEPHGPGILSKIGVLLNR